MTAVVVTGVPAAPGVAIGPVWRYEAAPARGADPGAAADPRPPDTRIRSAAGAAAAQLEGLAAAVRARGGGDEAAILEAQSLMALDPALVDEAVRLAGESGDPVAAVRDAAGPLAAMLAGLDDPLLAARSADVLDVAERIARMMLGVAIQPPTRPSIAVGADLPPSVTAELPPGSLLGIALEGSTPLAHAAILARGLGIPAVVGAAGLLAAVGRAAVAPDPLEIALDGATGDVVIAPRAEQRADYASRVAAVAARRARAAGSRGRPGATADGTPVRLMANIGSPRDAARALAAGAEGVGLMRTEFLFMERARPPTETEQTAAYRAVFEAFGPDRPVVVRLADIGGDKPLPYLAMDAEANPFLGVRGIRLALRSRELFLTQLRAISRAGSEAGVTPHVMAPMVATVGDVELFDSLCDEAQAQLAAEGSPRAGRLMSGIMVEVPAAAVAAGALARRVGFFSIGTNDLTQYLFAADRTNAALGHLQDALHPALLLSIAGVVAGARSGGIHVAVCGELAGDPAGALVLAGLGVDELSADANALDEVRAVLAAAAIDELRDLATAAVAAEDGAGVRRLAAPFVARVGGT